MTEFICLIKYIYNGAANRAENASTILACATFCSQLPRVIFLKWTQQYKGLLYVVVTFAHMYVLSKWHAILQQQSGSNCCGKVCNGKYGTEKCALQEKWLAR